MLRTPILTTSEDLEFESEETGFFCFDVLVFLFCAIAVVDDAVVAAVVRIEDKSKIEELSNS
jgi:hypothetical protein